MSFNSLPKVIVHHILSYTSNFKLRNGKYMGQISKKDKRYKMLQKIPRVFDHICNNHFYILTVNKKFIIIVWEFFKFKQLKYEYHFKNNNSHKLVCFIPK